MSADLRLLASFDTAAHGWRVAAGEYRVSVGADAADAGLTGVAMVVAQTLKP